MSLRLGVEVEEEPCWTNELLKTADDIQSSPGKDHGVA